jgi:adenosylcobinamide-phosphate synthase
MATLPLVSRPWWQWWSLVLAAERDGASDPSPNAGRSEAIYAHCAGVRLGGRNRYSRGWIEKPVLAADQPPATKTSVERILRLNLYLQGLWMLILLVLG